MHIIMLSLEILNIEYVDHYLTVLLMCNLGGFEQWHMYSYIAHK